MEALPVLVKERRLLHDPGAVSGRVDQAGIGWHFSWCNQSFWASVEELVWQALAWFGPPDHRGLRMDPFTVMYK